MREFHPIQTTGDLIRRVTRVLLVGLIIGLIASLAAQALVWCIDFGARWINGHRVIYPRLITVITPMLGGLAVGLIVQSMREQRPHTPADVILAAQSNLKLASLKLKDGFLNFIASMISLTSGASVGQYGPIVNIGATLSSNLQRFTRTEHTVLIGCGVAAAISSAFSAPIAGIIFAHEVILRHYSLRAFAPITIAASSAFYLSKFVFHNQALFELPEIKITYLSEFIGFTVVGVLAGLLAVAFLHAILYARLLANKVPLHARFKPMIAGLLVGLLALQLPDILGIGASVLRETLHAATPSALDLSILLIAKILATALCLGFGFAGGVFSPSLLIGVVFGTLFGLAMALLFPETNIQIYAICGMAAITSPIIGAPLTTILIIFELTQSYELTTAVMISVVFSNVVAYRLFGRSLFDFQLKTRGYDLSNGRDPLILGTQSIHGITRQNVTELHTSSTVNAAIKQLTETQLHQGFIVDTQQVFVGKVDLVQLIQYREQGEQRLETIKDLINPHCLRFNADTSIWQAMQDIKGFVGERIPVVNPDDQHLLGVIHEADLIDAYLTSVKALRNEETANA